MNTYAVIVLANSKDEAYSNAEFCAKRFGKDTPSLCMNYLEDQDFFISTVNIMIKEYSNLKNASKNIIKNVENKVSEDDYILSQLKQNILRYNEHKYRYPDEWKIVFFENDEIEHIDSKDYFDEIINSHDKKNIYLIIIN